jgi:hypothetical protein
MIRYALACGAGHDFDSWFPSGASYDSQAAGGLVQCPVCGSTQVAKRLMAPAVGVAVEAPRQPRAREADGVGPAGVPAVPAPAPPVALLSERDMAIRAMLRAVREHVTRNADYVGQSFAEEARKMHEGEIEHRSIYGEANPAEVRALLEDGIEVHPLPPAPDERN